MLLVWVVYISSKSLNDYTTTPLCRLQMHSPFFSTNYDINDARERNYYGSYLMIYLSFFRTQQQKGNKIQAFFPSFSFSTHIWQSTSRFTNFLSLFHFTCLNVFFWFLVYLYYTLPLFFRFEFFPLAADTLYLFCMLPP